MQREPYPLEEWIDSGEREAILEPDLPIVDAHHHLWDARIQDKGWPVSPFTIKLLYKLNPSLLVKLMVRSQDPRIIALFSDKLPAAIPYMETEMMRDMKQLKQSDQPITPEMATESTGHNFVTTCYMESGWSDPKATNEAMKPIPEVAMAQDVASRTNNQLCAGIIGHIPLGEGADNVRPALKTMVEKYPNFRGIRDELSCREGLYPLDANKGKPYDSNFRSGFSVLSEFNLTFDAWVYQDNLPALRDLALAFPDTAIICDHVGCPVTAGQPERDLKTSFESWAPSLKELATDCPNVMVKLSGLGMKTVGFGFETRPSPPSSNELAEAWKPYILHVIECFGVDRCMFASNFPVDKVSCSYTAMFNAFKIIVKDFSAEDKRKLFCDNAVRVYRLTINA